MRSTMKHLSHVISGLLSLIAFLFTRTFGTMTVNEKTVTFFQGNYLCKFNLINRDTFREIQWVMAGDDFIEKIRGKFRWHQDFWNKTIGFRNSNGELCFFKLDPDLGFILTNEPDGKEPLFFLEKIELRVPDQKTY
jgi:hypothetical protein